MVSPVPAAERPFDIDEKKTARSTRWLCVVIAVEWFFAFFPPFTLFSIAIVGLLPFAMFRVDRPTRWWLLGTSPLTLIVGLGIVQYFSGGATLRTAGLPETKFFNLDPATRCERSGGGCLVCGNEWLTNDLHNWTIGALVHSFGYSRGAYTGPYPTEEEARTALATAQEVAWADLRNDEIPWTTDLIRLQAGVGSALCDHAQRFRFTRDDLDRVDLKIRAVLWQKECLILRVPVNPDDPGSAMIVLVSRAVGRPFGYYEEGEYHHHVPPVFWTPSRFGRPV